MTLEPLHVPAIDRAAFRMNAWASCVAGIIGLALLLVPGLAILSVAFLLIPLGGGWVAAWCRPLLRRGTLADDEGIGPTEDGARLWTLPWSRFGGYRRAPAAWRRRIFRPGLSGYEVLDREGFPAFTAPLNAHTRIILASALMDEMDRRVPEGGYPYDRSLGRKEPPSLRSVRIALVLGFVLTVAALWGLAQPILSRTYIVGILGCLFAPVAYLTALAMVGERRLWAQGKLPRPRIPPPLPEEGPVLERHVATHGNTPIRLEEGMRYRLVEPERIRVELRNGLPAARWCAAGFFGIVVFCVGSIWSDPKAWAIGLFAILLFGGLGICCLLSMRWTRVMLDSLDDVLWVHDGALVVVRPEKEPLVLSLPKTSDPMARFRRSWLEATDVWRVPGGERYYLDRTRIYAAPSDVDLEKERESP